MSALATIRDALTVALEDAMRVLDHTVESRGPQHPATDAARTVVDCHMDALAAIERAIAVSARPVARAS